MNYINFAYGTLVTLIIFIVLIRFWMEVANYIGNKLRIDVFFMNLLDKIQKRK